MFHDKDSNTVAVVPNFGDHLDKITSDEAYRMARTVGELWKKADVIVGKDEEKIYYASTMATVVNWEFDGCAMNGGYSDRCPYRVEHWMSMLYKGDGNES